MTIFVISDTHFTHGNILKFLRPDGSPVRDFPDVEAMDEHMIAQWNATVRPCDHVYHLGDVAMRSQAIDAILPRLNGHLRLVRGNHDIFRTKLYLKYFDEIYGIRVLNNWLMTHMPVHPESLGRFKGNVHGHIHANTPPAGAYLNVSVEAINYTPIALEALTLAEYCERVGK
jgi:calcineurin-like phosphoesterase family protein